MRKKRGRHTERGQPAAIKKHPHHELLPLSCNLPAGASLTAPGSIRMLSLHFLALLPEWRSKRVKEKRGRPWPPATRASQEEQ